MFSTRRRRVRGAWQGPQPVDERAGFKLRDNSRIGVIGGGPAGSFFSYFVLETAERMGLPLAVDIFEPRDFSRAGPAGCNMCGGVISESLVQALALEGIQLPPAVVQRGLDAYVLHMDVGEVEIQTPLQEKRIAVVHRGGGPRGVAEAKWGSFDGYLLELAIKKGARRLAERVEKVEWANERPLVKAAGGGGHTYDLLVVATGVNSSSQRLLAELKLNYRPPATTKTFITELCLGQSVVEQYFRNAMHVFLLDLPRLEFAALIPKGDYVTLCLLGSNIDQGLVESFLAAPEVKKCLPPDWTSRPNLCHCAPRISIAGAVQPFADRLVFVGDCGVTRLYKDGIGAAYRAAKVAAVTAVIEGVSAQDFREHYWPVCRAIGADNAVGKLMFTATRLVQHLRFARRGILRMTAKEQRDGDGHRRMSTVLWDMFTGSAPYQSILRRTLHPSYLGVLLRETVLGLWARRTTSP